MGILQPAGAHAKPKPALRKSLGQRMFRPMLFFAEVSLVLLRRPVLFFTEDKDQ
jgi:hypothetical protein